MKYSIEAVSMVWGVSLVIALVVIVVVALLLHLIKKTARDIEGGASAIWTQGKLVANNTIHIPTLLGTTSAVGDQILSNAVEILGGIQKVESHIGGCPGCPECVLKHDSN